MLSHGARLFFGSQTLGHDSQRLSIAGIPLEITDCLYSPPHVDRCGEECLCDPLGLLSRHRIDSRRPSYDRCLSATSQPVGFHPKPSSPIRCIPHPISKSHERCWNMGCICSGLAAQSNRKQAVDPSRLGQASARLLRMATRREIMCHACVGSG